MRTVPASPTVPFAAIVPKLPTLLPEMATLPPVTPDALTVPLTSTSSAEARATSPSVAEMLPSTATLPAAVALTDLPWRSLPEATDSCFGEMTTSEPAFFKPPTFTLPAATTPSLKSTLPSVATSRSPATLTALPSEPSSANVTSTSSASSAKSLNLIETLPPSTLSTTSLSPAASVVCPTLNSLPPCTETFLPSRATLAPLKAAPFPTETSPIMSPSLGIDMSASGAPALISDSRVSLLARFAAATPNNPATFTWAPFMNETPAGLNTHTLPFAFSVPAICEALPPLTTL